MRSTCALSGHRELPPSFDKNAVYDKLESFIREGCDKFLCGMAEGFDLLALECLIDLKKKYNIYIEACVPFEGQENRFSPEKKRKYREEIVWCDKKTVLFPEYRNGCYLIRNRYMVDCCDFLFAYCVRDLGGTAYTVKYAEGKNIPVILFP